MIKYTVRVESDNIEADQFVVWLNDQGHSASISDNTGAYIDGRYVASDEDARDIMCGLWDSYCKS